ncbi:hypothetical protein SCHPADRAFT_906425 [Schizopora paradoxa]|uniref:Uncharacterized protein n=1 Tax=Schizopora paradoxa TaxID=27342 RepID=A0A0H2S1W2_9AGAM|nr:hypothetical protein SCHPADRAFT_906425 [Schizopora paradoxa]
MGLFATHEQIPAAGMSIAPSESSASIASRSSGSHSSISSMSSSSLSTTLQPPPRIHINTQVSSHSHVPGSPSRPRLRKRRSSLTVANSPLGTVGLRSPSRAAANSYSRTVLMSPSKSQTIAYQKSISKNVAETGGKGDGQGQSFMQRLRSGSFRTRRGPIPRKPAPAPPTLPLPEVPSQSYAQHSPTRASFRPTPSHITPLSLPLPIHAPQPRKVLADSSLYSPNAPASASLSQMISPASAYSCGADRVSSGAMSTGTTGVMSPGATYLTPDFALKLVMAMTTPPGSTAPSPVDPIMIDPGYAFSTDDEMRD